MSTAGEKAALPTTPLNALDFPLWGSRLIEASAGTGKTYTIASLYVRLVLGHGELPEGRPLTPPDILVVTFTRAATQELRDRIRRRLNEAAGCFLDEAGGDDFLLRLRDEYEPERWPACARLLRIAAEWMDDAAVSTIDAWCYRMLREHAFDSASLFEMEMDVDEAERVAEATRDYWRLFIAPLDAADIGRVLHLVGTQMAGRWAAAVDCDALAGILRRWLPHVRHYGESPEPADVLARIRRQNDEWKAQWRCWVPEVRELLQAAYDAGLYDKGRLRINHWTGWLDRLEEWASEPAARLPFDRNGAAWSRLTREGLAAVWKTGSPPEHPAFDAMSHLLDDIEGLDAQLARLLPHAACWVARRMADLRRQRAMLDFGGLLEQMDAALSGPNGAKLAGTIRAQFPAALIDEFQDTNPVQYRIFDSIYKVETNSRAALLALIGDPKQAIYRFRGADIHAYLRARRDCAGRLYTLDKNYRSSPAMVGAVNHLFLAAEQSSKQGAFLFRQTSGRDAAAADPVPFHPVEAATDPGQWRVGGAPGAALTIWCDISHDRRESCADAVAEGCASEILRLLQLADEGEAGFHTDGGFTALRAGDIAILVNNRHEAAGLRAALARRGIRSVYLSDDSSVYRCAAAPDVLAWLRACAEPENGGYVRAALATASLGLPWSDLDNLIRDEVRWEAMLERFAAYKEQWRRRGVLPMLRTLMHEFGVPARLFSGQQRQNLEGERHLTDLLHLAELLQAASGRLDGEHAVIRYLEEHIERGGEPGIDGDVSRMRLESDAGLVQIVTVHKSKGLEYPLVFYPHAYHSRPAKKLELPAVYRDREGESHALANLADVGEAQRDEIRAQLEHERLAEDLRKLYVALTRARHATWMALAPVDTLGASACGYLLGGPQACAADVLESSLSALVGDSAEIAIESIPSGSEGRYRAADGRDVATVWRSMRRRIEQRWAMSSYSALARLAMERPENAAALYPDAAALALPDEARVDTFLETYAAEAGGGPFDTAAPGSTATGDRDAVSGGAGSVAAGGGTASSAMVTEAGGIHAFPKGAAAGSFLHGLLEWVFRRGAEQVLTTRQSASLAVYGEVKRGNINAAPPAPPHDGGEAPADRPEFFTDQAELCAFIARRCRSRGWENHSEALAGWLTGFFRQAFRVDLPGCGRQADLTLASLSTALPEMEFWFGARDSDLPALDALVTRHFTAGRLRPVISRGRLNGMLRGFVDLIFEHDGRYYVADYKSNWLGPTSDAYHGEALVHAILEHRYDLQAAIYLYALHRHLKARLGERYDYDRHVGAALVFFVRGYGAAGQGLHIERPPREAMERLEWLFEGGDRTHDREDGGRT